MKEKIGLIGRGFVGEALYNVFSKEYFIEVFDLDKAKSTVNSLEELVNKVKIIFLALPTPINEKEEAYLDHIYEVYDKISSYDKNNIIVIKSSVQPGTTKKINEKYKNIKTVFNPEFLREKTHFEDFKNQSYIILGGEEPETEEVSKLYNKVFPEVPIYKSDSTTAEMTKFFINVFLATKVSFCNEIFNICNSLNINYNDVINLALLDNRIGNSHTKVPGDPTEKALHGRGFGLTCFPINLSILIDLANKLNVDAKILKAVKLRNETIDRPEKDWLVDNKTIVKK
jgi:UDPglucose 6-dehydrogenase